ncbi:MAG: tyrosine-type recombinase/integrase [Chloroflexota bacterium]
MNNLSTVSLPQFTTISDQESYLSGCLESFLADRKAAGRAPKTIKFYSSYLAVFVFYCEAQAITNIHQINPDFLRRYLLLFQKEHNPGGVHAAFRALRAFFLWIEFEDFMPIGWKNPISRVKAPKVPFVIKEPIAIEDIAALLDTCKSQGVSDLRDKAIFLTLFDAGMRSQELCDLDVKDVDFKSGRIMIRKGKGQKARICFISPLVIAALREYLEKRSDLETSLFLSFRNHPLTYDGLRQMLERRIKTAKLKTSRSLHDFRRAFAINMLRKKVDIYSLQKLMGHSDLTVLRRYLAQNEDDIHNAHNQGSPVDNFFSHPNST